jgi:hypothetical protein
LLLREATGAIGGAVDREVGIHTDIHLGCRRQSVELHADDAVAVALRQSACRIDKPRVDADHAVAVMMQPQQQTPARMRCKFNIGWCHCTLEPYVYDGSSPTAPTLAVNVTLGCSHVNVKSISRFTPIEQI